MATKLRKIVLVEPARSSWTTSFFVGEHQFDPIELGYLSSFLRQNGYDVSIFQQREETNEQVINFIISQKPVMVGFSTMTFNFNKGRKLAKTLKSLNPDIKIVFGGYHVTANSDALNFPEIDFLVMGEGEETLKELVDCLLNKNGIGLEKITGLGYKKDGEIIVNPRRPRIKNLDALPFPERYGLESCHWGAPIIPTPNEQKAFAQVTYSRGCHHNCSFCISSKLWQGQVIYRSAKNMVDEIEYLMREFGTNGLFFTDLTFNADRQKVIELCDEIKSRNIKISWMTACRITDDTELLEKMKNAGCVKIAYGVESLENKTLDSLKKDTSLENIIKCFEITDSLGIITRAYLMLGYPEESQESITRLIENLKKLPADQLRFSFITPFPGTPFHTEMVEKDLILSDNLDDYDTVTVPIIKTSLSSEELKQSVDVILKNFYTSPAYLERIRAKCEKFPYLKPAFDYFFERLKNQPFWSS